MRISLKRIILTIALAVLLVIAFGWIIMMQNHATLIRNHAGDESLKQEEVMQTLEDISSSWRIMERRIRARYKENAALSALAHRDIIEEDGGQAVSVHSNGAVIRVTDDEVAAPEGIGQKLGLTPEMFEAREGLFASPENENTLVAYSLISSPYYYVEWYEDTSIRKEVEEEIDIPGILRKAETAYNVYALCAAEDPDSDTGERILYSNDVIAELQDTFVSTETADLNAGETAEVIYEEFSEEADEEIPYESGTLSLKNSTFYYAKSAVPEIGGYLVLLSIQPNLYVKALSQGTYMFTALILFLAALLTTGFSLYFFIQKNELTPDQEKRYMPSNVRRFASLYGVIGAVLIFLSGMLVYALNGLYDDTARGKERLQMLAESLEMYSERVEQNMNRFQEIYIDYGTHIAELLDEHPELQEQSVLENLAESISASSITLYDANGSETVSSAGYIGLSLGSSPDSPMYDFRRILNGVPYIVHGQVTDEISGRNDIRLGLRIRDISDPAKYGVMIVSLDPALWNFDLSEKTDQILQSLSGDNVLLCIASPETGEILSSGREGLTGRDISALGLSETDLRDSLIKNVKTEEGSLFVTSALLQSGKTKEGAQASEKLIAYYAAPRAAIFAGMMASSLTGCLLFILIYAVLAWLVLRSYTDDYYEQNRGKNLPGGQTQKGWPGIRRALSSVRPEKTGLITMEFIIFLYLTQQIPVANFSTAISRNSVYYYLTSGSWEKGLNLFAIAGIMLLLAQILLAVVLVRILLAVCSTFTGPKGKTICRLLKSLAMYLALFSFLILALTYLGISLAVILAAVGTLSIAISLGAQHFVSDIIAGLTLVFEGTVHAGDIVDLGMGSMAYHGEILEIGLRFVRLQTIEKNIVTLSNREIQTITNMSRLNSRCICEITVSSEYPIDEIEEMLRRELPKIGEQDRRILAGPEYNGITALEGGTMTLSVTAECREQDLSYVQWMVNRSLQSIFMQNGYRI